MQVTDGFRKLNVATRGIVSIWSGHFGCYYCEETFMPHSITKYTDDNYALCPFCSVDSVVSTTDTATLGRLREKYFAAGADV